MLPALPIFMDTVPKVFDAQVIEDCLRAQERLDEDNHVTNVTEEQLSGHEGNTGTQLKRIHIEYEKEQERPLPKTMVLKLSDTSKLKGPSQRDSALERFILYSAGMSDVNMLHREAIFYNKFHSMVSDPCGLKIPEIYFTAISGHSNFITRTLFILFKRKEHVRGAILMEDLSEGRNLDAVEDCPNDMLQILCTEIGRLYGYTAKCLAEGGGDLGAQNKLPKAFTYQMCLMTSGMPRLVKRRWRPNSNLVHKAITRWGDTDYSLLRENEEIRTAMLSLEKNFVPNVYKLHKQLHNYVCILQGDFHAGNFMIMPNGEVKMFDMQMWGVGHPAEEVCYFMASNVDPSEENDMTVLRMVHSAMETASQGIVKYPFEKFKRDVEVCTIHFMAACMVRRALFDTPESVGKLSKKLGRVMDSLQRVLRVREERLMKRVTRLWRNDPNFVFAEVPKTLQNTLLVTNDIGITS